jgi:hypothetical protein
MNKGILKETFFLNQIKQRPSISSSEMSDFLVDNKYIIEIGGQSKNQNQIEGRKMLLSLPTILLYLKV